jgi:hypothetical protein
LRQHLCAMDMEPCAEEPPPAAATPCAEEQPQTLQDMPALAAAEEAHAEEAEDDVATSTSSERSEPGWDNVYEKRRLMRDELSLANDHMRGCFYWMTYGGGPEGGFATRGEHGEGRVWSMDRSWHADWHFQRLIGQALEVRTTDEGFVRCRLRASESDDEDDEGNDEDDEGNDEDEEDEGEPDAMDAATVFGTESANDSSDVHTWSEGRNDKLHMTMAAARAIAETRATTAAYEKDDMSVAFSAWRVCVQMARVEKSVPYRE